MTEHKHKQDAAYKRQLLMTLDRLSLGKDGGLAAKAFLESEDLEADWHIFNELRVGSLIRTTQDGQSAVVVAISHLGRKVISVVFESGRIEKLNLVLWLMLDGHYIGHQPLDYHFESDAQVKKDLESGVFFDALQRAVSLEIPSGDLQSRRDSTGQF